MKYKIGDIVDARGGMGFHWPGPWVITKISSIANGEFYSGMHLSNSQLTRIYPKAGMEKHRATRYEKELAKLILVLFG